MATFKLQLGEEVTFSEIFLKSFTWHFVGMFMAESKLLLLAPYPLTTNCSVIFMYRFTSKFVHNAIHDTNEYYGGIEAFMHVTNVVFTNGNIDPWHALGVTRRSEVNRGNTVLLIPGKQHLLIFAKTCSECTQCTHATKCAN